MVKAESRSFLQVERGGGTMSEGQVTGEGRHADTEGQAQSEDTITAQCPLAA